MRFGSLFSGIGGIDLGLERAGMKCAWQVEIDDYCQRILYKHWPNVPKHKDVKEVGEHNLERVDLIAGGFPCQPFSAAGRQRGKDDERYLWPEMLRIIRELRPAWVLGENVARIVQLALDEVLTDLEAEGYACRPFIIPAVAIGAEHRRDRVWIVAHTDSKRLEGVYEASRGEYLQPTSHPVSRDFGSATPRISRGTDGIPNRVDRIKCLGNAVVPQVVTEIGKAIMGCV